ncbi:amidohydrolase family protein [Nocardia noduli]|uniref:amidohydrolase family protein n=1 Tax=Nocardia noduli TaxID=2815722 RepID=UPI001C2240CB|nr:amidohydrolase family protein [Nocardia noduli]
MTSTEYDLDWLISVDDHVLEPPNVWQDRIAANDRDRAPKLVRDGDAETWVYENRSVPTNGLSAVVGKSAEEFSPEAVTYAEMRPGCYDAAARVEDMNEAGILASLSFPSFPRFCGQIFYEAQDKDLALRCVQAYNDWMIDEWCGSAPGRFIPLVIMPLWDTTLAVTEIERTAAKGARGLAFSENFEPLGLPTINDPNRYWDPVLQAASDNELVVCMHVGSSSTLPNIASDAPFMANLAWGATRTSGTMLQWLFSDHFAKLPNLKIALSEGNIGWIPYFLERAEQVYNKQRFWAARGVTYEGHAASDVPMDIDLRQRFRDHVFGCFIEDESGIAAIDVIGENNIMIETDYPHSDSTWPNCIEVAKKQIAHLPEATQYKILRGNAEKLFRFTPAVPPTRAGA